MMEEGFRLKDARIAIVGLGLMGGSLALALKGSCAALYGIDTDQNTLRLARLRRVVDEADDNPARLLAESDLIVLAAPVPSILDLIGELSRLTQNPCILIDLGSTKAAIVSAMEKLPSNFDVLGGHPICGKEKLSLENAEASLYRGATIVVTPLERTTNRARSAILQISRALGAHLLEMTAEEHDQALAFTSHLPYLLSSAISRALPLQYSGLVGPGFRSTARLAGTPASLMLGVLRTNRKNILRALSEFQQQVADVHAALSAGEFRRLEELLDGCNSAYHRAVNN